MIMTDETKISYERSEAKMNGSDLMDNLIDELERARGLLQLYVNGIEVPETTSEELINDIDGDLDKYYDVAEVINDTVRYIDI